MADCRRKIGCFILPVLYFYYADFTYFRPKSPSPDASRELAAPRISHARLLDFYYALMMVGRLAPLTLRTKIAACDA